MCDPLVFVSQSPFWETLERKGYHWSQSHFYSHVSFHVLGMMCGTSMILPESKSWQSLQGLGSLFPHALSLSTP
jgi:hypothetical protein